MYVLDWKQCERLHFSNSSSSLHFPTAALWFDLIGSRRDVRESISWHIVENRENAGKWWKVHESMAIIFDMIVVKIIEPWDDNWWLQTSFENPKKIKIIWGIENNNNFQGRNWKNEVGRGKRGSQWSQLISGWVFLHVFFRDQDQLHLIEIYLRKTKEKRVSILILFFQFC